MILHTEPNRLLRALAGAEAFSEAAHSAVPSGPTVVISRDCGAYGGEIAVKLAERLGVCCFNRDLLKAIAQAAHADPFLMEQLDDRNVPLMDEWVQSFLSKPCTHLEEYHHALVQVVLSIAARGGVIVGRGAHLLLARRKVYRVRLVGSPEVCAERVARKEGLSLEAAHEKVIRTNRDRAAFVHKCFQADINDPAAYDLWVNTDRHDPEQVVEIILRGMRAAGFEMPGDRVRSRESSAVIPLPAHF